MKISIRDFILGIACGFLFVIILLLLMLGSVKNQTLTNNGSQNEEIVNRNSPDELEILSQEDQIANFEKEFEMKLNLPEGYTIQTEHEQTGVDTGKRYTITVSDQRNAVIATLSATSSDYEQGAGEGSPIAYAGENSMEGIQIAYPGARNIKLSDLNNPKMISFYDVVVYGDIHTYYRSIISLDHPIYKTMTMQTYVQSIPQSSETDTLLMAESRVDSGKLDQSPQVLAFKKLIDGIEFVVSK